MKIAIVGTGIAGMTAAHDLHPDQLLLLPHGWGAIVGASSPK